MLNFGTVDNHDDLPDTSETLRLSSLALLKMLRHGRAGVPMEVMGMLLGEYCDDYTIQVDDVYAMPQRGTGVTVEAVDPVYQAEMNEVLVAVGKPENCVGWYHSHPGFGCWLSNVDCSTQGNFEKLNKRAVAVVVDPIQSVKGKVVLDAFRLIKSQHSLIGVAPRQITSNLGYEEKPTLVSIVHGLNRSYYGFRIEYMRKETEMKMLARVKKKTWAQVLMPLKKESCINEEVRDFIKNGDKKMIGRTDYKRKLEEKCEEKTNEEVIANLLMAVHCFIFAA